MTGKAVVTVGEIYEAFGRGDVPAVLERLADDVAWDVFDDNTAQAAGVPYFQPRRGKEGVLEFFGVIADWEIRRFEITALGGDDRIAVAEIVTDVVTPAGPLRDEEAHVWHVGDDGRVTRLRHYIDTAKHASLAARLPVAGPDSSAG